MLEVTLTVAPLPSVTMAMTAADYSDDDPERG